MKKSSFPLRIWKLLASSPSRVRTLLLPLASGSVMVRSPILIPEPITVFSAMELAERVIAVGASLISATAVMLIVDIATLLLDPSLTVMLMTRLVVLRVPAILL